MVNNQCTLENVTFVISKLDSICIVGSGIGGGTLAARLKETCDKCFIVESGNTHAQSKESVSHQMSGRDFGIRSTRAIQLGGTSNLWHGVLAPLDEIDFKKRDWVDASGWPINYEDLKKHYAQAADILGPLDTKFYFLDGLTTKIINMLTDLKFDREVLTNKIFQQPIPTKNFREILTEKKCDDLVIYTGLTALKLDLDCEGNVVGLYVGKESGEIGYVTAKKYVVSTGALESPRLLLNSNIKNKSIGKYLMDHPMGNLFQIRFPEKVRAHIYSDYKFRDNCKIKTGLVLPEELQKKYKLLNHCFYFRPSFVKGIDNKSEKIKLSLLAFKDGGVTFKDAINVLLNFNVVFQILIYKLSLNVKYRYADIFCVTEQKPNENSFVKLSHKLDNFGMPIADVHWCVTDEEENQMETVYNIIKEEGLSGFGYEFTHELNDINWSHNYSSAAHHVGTCRMSETPESGVVDKNLKVHGIKNLYVCDGSVFPTSGNVNSSFTISALACRLAQHLSERQ